MRILCLIESLIPGGAERQMTGLASLLKKEGHEVAVWTYYPQDFYKGQLDEAGVEYRCIIKAKSKLRRIPVLLKEARKWKPDVMISYLPTGTMVACVMKMLGLKTKLIVSERNTSQQYGLKEKIRFYLFKKEADWVVPNSYTQKRFILSHYPSLVKKVRVITNFVDTGYFSPATETDQNDKTLRMICVGRLVPQKNVLRFIDVVTRLKWKGIQLKIDWFGRTDGDYAEQCIEKIKQEDLSDVIEFRGVTSDIRDEYRKADVFCMPSLWEGFPNVRCEAMSCGLPVLCSKVCDNAEIVKDGENGFLFDPLSINDMTNSITRFVMSDDKTRREMAGKSREMALETFSADVFVKQYMEIIS